MFENKLTHNGIHYTRYIMSWIRSGGDLNLCKSSNFAKWLKESQQLTDEEIRDICEIATNGKMELEDSVKLWLKGMTPVKEKKVKTYDEKMCRAAEASIGDLGSAFDDIYKQMFGDIM